MKNVRSLLISGIVALTVFVGVTSQVGCGGGGTGVGVIKVEPVNEVLKALASATTEASMRSAINKVLDKTGLGRPQANTKYSVLRVSNDELERVARLNIVAAPVTLGALHLSLEQHIRVPLTADRATIWQRLQTQANQAFAGTRETAEAAMLILMLSDYPPSATAPQITAETQLKAVQALLYCAWVVREFTSISRQVAGSCVEICNQNYNFDVSKCVSIALYNINEITKKVGLRLSYIPAQWTELESILVQAGLGSADIATVRGYYNAMVECIGAAGITYQNCLNQCHQQGEVRSAVESGPCCGR